MIRILQSFGSEVTVLSNHKLSFTIEESVAHFHTVIVFVSDEVVESGFQQEANNTAANKGAAHFFIKDLIFHQDLFFDDETHS